jgi:hypothetical protein
MSRHSYYIDALKLVAYEILRLKPREREVFEAASQLNDPALFIQSVFSAGHAFLDFGSDGRSLGKNPTTLFEGNTDDTEFGG